ncbi:hypothetical protein L9F63_028006, partial [Diploptera punctata]
STFVIGFMFNSCLMSVFLSIVFLTFSVCEGALGLSILVSIIRSYGNDFFILIEYYN